MRLLFPALGLLALAGCSHSREGDVVGRWTSARGVVYVFDASKSVAITVRSVGEKGTWSIAGDDVSLVVTEINGRSAADLKAKLEAKGASQTARQKRVIAMLGAPEVFHLDPTGKSMTRQESGQTVVLTKG